MNDKEVIVAMSNALLTLFVLKPDYTEVVRVRQTIVWMWGEDPLRFQEQIRYAFRNELAAVRIAAVQATAKSPMNFRSELKTAYETPDRVVRMAVVNVWGKFPIAFRKDLLAAISDSDLDIAKMARNALHE